MKKVISTLFLIAAYAATNVIIAQTPYDNFAPEQGIKPMLELPSMQFKVKNQDIDSEIKYIEFDNNSMSLNYISGNDSIISSVKLQPTDLKWWTVDPKAEEYYDWSPYNYVLCNPIRNIDPFGEDVYILFYTVGNDHGDEAFRASAQTRKEEIEAMKGFNAETDKVIMFGVSDISDMGSLTDWAVNTYSEQFGQTAEVGVWSHAGWDGPIGTETASNNPLYEGSSQMSMEGWSNINFNWKSEGSKMGFYGCNTGNDTYNNQWVGSFARNISEQDNFSGVNVWGQSSWSYPSFYPHIRATNAARSLGMGFGVGSTYMVGGNLGEGRKASWYVPGAYPAANPMNVYRNGKKVRSAYQGF